MSNKVVAFCINNLKLAGAENITLNLFLECYDDGYFSKDSKLILLNNNIHQSFMNELEKREIQVVCFSSRKELLYLELFTMFLKAFKHFFYNKYEFVYVNLSPSLFIYGILKLFGLLNNSKLFFTEHSVSNNRPSVKIFVWFETIIYNFYDSIICISLDVKKSLINRIKSHDKVVIINNGLPPLRVSSTKSISIRAELGISNESKLIMMVSRIGDGKDHWTLVRAVKELLRLGKDVNLIFAGSGDFSEIIYDIRESGFSNKFHFLGSRTDARYLMSQVDLNVLSSKYEGISGVTLESFEAKKPFLGSNVPGIKELVGDDYSLFEFGDHNELAQKILILLSNNNRANEMIEKNYEKLELFSFSRQVNSIKNLFEE